MNFIYKEPETGTKKGEIRYWSFIDFSLSNMLLLKVKCLKKRWDSENNYYIYYCEILEKYVDTFGYHIGQTTIVDYFWQLQDTLQNAQHLMIYGLLEKGRGAYFSLSPPWK